MNQKELDQALDQLRKRIIETGAINYDSFNDPEGHYGNKIYESLNNPLDKEQRKTTLLELIDSWPQKAADFRENKLAKIKNKEDFNNSYFLDVKTSAYIHLSKVIRAADLSKDNEIISRFNKAAHKDVVNNAYLLFDSSSRKLLKNSFSHEQCLEAIKNLLKADMLVDSTSSVSQYNLFNRDGALKQTFTNILKYGETNDLSAEKQLRAIQKFVDKEARNKKGQISKYRVDAASEQMDNLIEQISLGLQANFAGTYKEHRVQLKK